MAKIVKDERNVINVDEELNKIQEETRRKSKKVEKKEEKPNNNKKKNTKKKSTKKSKSKIAVFFKEVKSELSKVKWPNRKDMIKYSVATIGFVIFFAVFFYIIDLIIALLKAGV